MFEDLRPHLVELRKRLGLSVISVFIMFAIAFTFHQYILAWVTQPLNDALTQVGLIIENKGTAHWKIQQDENTTEITVKKPEYQSNSAQSYAYEASQSAQKLHDNLSQASDVAVKQSNPELASLLKEAATSAKTTAEATSKLITLLDDVNHSVENASKKTFEGMVTTHQIGGVFFVALKVSFFAALLGALPFILYQLWLFVSPGLYANEKKMIIPFVVGGSIMFFIGVLFAYYVVTPFGFQFLITFGSFLYTPLINIEDYVGFFAKIMMGFGIAFELPVFAYFLALLGLVTDKSLKDFFKYAILIIFVLAALLTPPDVLTQLLMAFPLILLYGISILIVRMVNPYKEDEDEEEVIEAKDS
ncbi:twin-arginine translocase subunit TatC [Sulfurovum sp. zt1-1]|uniref:Sec-independent protein translocase protein TatC n=1 Tax=Sulfurovum zhangzhouensis TaxID=3019067 RepID=A0ABT7R0S8_9BACT|nr:twin-arginine translocase subunit TatC [Sulfurovum zhangzhouensis]MDM5272699.1 twin-arginine translocase subunit TatC [Sulfurovum zhangzhouensis]